jgi:hypothetical protein
MAGLFQITLQVREVQSKEMMNPHTTTESLVLDKSTLVSFIQTQNEVLGLTADPRATGEMAQQMTRDLGIHEEENLLSCGIVAARDEE